MIGMRDFNDKEQRCQEDYLTLHALIEKQMLRNWNQLANFDETQLNTLNLLLIKYPDLFNFLSGYKKLHPTLDELLKLNELNKIEHLVNLIKEHRKLLEQIIKYLSDEEFIELVCLEKASQDALFQLLTPTILALLHNKQIFFSQLMSLDDTQYDNLSDQRILDLITSPFGPLPGKPSIATLTIEEVLALTTEQREKIIEYHDQLLRGKVTVHSLLGIEDVSQVQTSSQPFAQTNPEEVNDTFSKQGQSSSFPNKTETSTQEIPNLSMNARNAIEELNEYIKRIEGYNGNFKQGFRFFFFKESRAASRKANYEMAKALKNQLSNNINVTYVFSENNLYSNRPYIEQARHKINSDDLKRIIKTYKS